MPRTREDIIAGLQALVDKYPDVTANKYRLNPTTGGQIVQAPIVKEATNPTRIFPTTAGLAPAPVKPVKERTYISPHVRGEDRKWLMKFLEE